MEEALDRPGTATVAPLAQVMQHARGYMESQVLYVAAKLGLADLIAADVTTPTALADATSTDPDALHRLLRALEELELVTRDGATGYALTAPGECLRDDHPNSVRHLMIMFGEEHYRTWSELVHSIRTGQPAVERVLGQPVFAYLASNPEPAATFNRAMADLVRNLHIPALASYDFTSCATVVDVGGGTGSLLRHILQANPHLRGVLFDQPQAIADAVPELRHGALADRCQLVAGDFFDRVPDGGDTYLLSIVLHDYDDERAVQLLRNIRAVTAPEGRLVALEGVLPEDGAPARGALNDLNMLVMSGGRERTAEQYRRLLAAAGFRLDRISGLPGPLDLLVAIAT